MWWSRTYKYLFISPKTPNHTITLAFDIWGWWVSGLFMVLGYLCVAVVILEVCLFLGPMDWMKWEDRHEITILIVKAEVQYFCFVQKQHLFIIQILFSILWQYETNLMILEGFKELIFLHSSYNNTQIIDMTWWLLYPQVA